MQVRNAEIARLLERIADLLEQQEANPFRVRAYREAAERVRETDGSLADLVREGDGDKLQELEGIGTGLAGVITEIVHQGRSSMLERLQAEVKPERVFEQIPGIGEALAESIVEHLEVTTLASLEQAAHDGRLAEVPGFGEERVRNVQVSLAGLLSGAAQRRARRVETNEAADPPEPDVGLLLEIDHQYREQAEAGRLRKIAPKRFNPQGNAWLPIMELEREGWQFTVLYSNTARAHELDKTDDWVVIYYRRNGEENQVTVVTETRGPLEGLRVVRGRETACRRYYDKETDRL